MAPRALVRFHLASSVRAALRLQAPLTACAIAGLTLMPDPGASVAAMAAAFGASGSPLLGPALAVVLALGLARQAAGPTSRAGRGWARSLPADARDHRLAGTIAVALALGPLLLALAVLVAAAPAPAAWERLAGLPLLGWSAALHAWPSRRRAAVATLALLASLASVHGSWLAVLAALGLALAAWRAGGDPRRVIAPAHRFPGWAATARPARLALRALGVRAASAWAPAALPLAVAAILRANNPDLAGADLAAAARLAALASVALATWSLAIVLARRRPPWAWARSLPMSSSRRAGEEACVLAALASPVVVASGLLLGWAAASIAALALPWLALRAAAWSRPQARTPMEDEGFAAAEAALTAGCLALLPWLALVSLLAAPVAARLASRRDRAWRVTAWDELRAARAESRT